MKRGEWPRHEQHVEAAARSGQSGLGAGQAARAGPHHHAEAQGEDESSTFLLSLISYIHIILYNVIYRYIYIYAYTYIYSY